MVRGGEECCWWTYIIAAGELVAVKTQKGVPDQVSAVACHETEDRVKSYTRSPAKSANSKAHAVGTKDVGGNEVEGGAPRG